MGPGPGPSAATDGCSRLHGRHLTVVTLLALSRGEGAPFTSRDMRPGRSMSGARAGARCRFERPTRTSRPCSRFAHDRTTPAGTERHQTTQDDSVGAGSVRSCSNLRIRCPKGRGGSNPPSRTPSDLGIFVPGPLRQVAQKAILLTLAHGTGRELIERKLAATPLTLGSMGRATLGKWARALGLQRMRATQDIRVLEGGRDVGLSDEPFAEGGVGGEIVGRELQRDPSACA
jgi:hypothetical protein